MNIDNNEWIKRICFLNSIPSNNLHISQNLENIASVYAHDNYIGNTLHSI